jgi:hypothetical protein
MGNGTAQLVFVDSGAVVNLSPHTTLRVPEQPPRVARLKHLRGRLLARVNADGETRRLEVELPPGLLVLEDPSGAPDAGELQVREAHVEIEDARTLVTMTQGQGQVIRRRGEPVAVEQDHFVELDSDGTVVHEGPAPAAVELGQPGAGAVIRTREDVTFSWQPLADIEDYVVEVQPDEGRPTLVNVGGGRNRTSLPLSSGDYRWSVRAVVNGCRGRLGPARHFTVELDREPPPLRLRHPAEGAAVSGARVTVRGTTEPGASVIVNGHEAEVSANGSFVATLSLDVGLSNIVVRATDSVGNVRVLSRAVLRE